MDYLQLAKKWLETDCVVGDRRAIAAALVDIADSLRAQRGGTGGRAEDQPL